MRTGQVKRVKKIKRHKLGPKPGRTDTPWTPNGDMYGEDKGDLTGVPVDFDGDQEEENGDGEE